MQNMKTIVAILIAGFSFPAGWTRAEPRNEIPPPLGPYIDLKSADFAAIPSFHKEDRLVAVTYFYWYDVYSKDHVIDSDGTDALTDHPASLEDFSYKSVRWHKKELGDMIEAGIDIALPVHWGAPSERSPKNHLHWSYAGLKPMVEAREALVKEGKNPPRLGLFYDTSTLQYNSWNQHIDLTADYGKQWFYATVRDFFSLIPPRHWARMEGRPIVVLYGAGFARKHDQGFVDYLNLQFAKDFGGRTPYLVREVSWQIKADNVTAWGGALGLKNPGVASIGPGYDHSAVPGRAPLIVDRKGGQFYEDNWLKFLRRPTHVALLETWNEFHEGTDICESKEYGRQYIELSRKYADLFKKGWRPPLPAGNYAGASDVKIVLGKQNAAKGMVQIENEDGMTEAAVQDGRECRALKPAAQAGHYIYFAVDDSFKREDSMNLEATVDYFDAAPGTLGLEYDGSDESAPFMGAYTRSKTIVKLTGDKTWKTARFVLPQARLLNSQNRNADLRLTIEAPEFYARQVMVARPKTADR